MKRRAILISSGALIVFAVVAFAQLPEQEPVASAPPPSAKYEMIQNSRAMKETYLLDRDSGNSWQLVQSTKRYVWQKIPKEPHEKDVVPMVWCERRGEYEYGQSQADVRQYLREHSEAHGYAAEHFADSVCHCSGRIFRLALDENEGAAVRGCTTCGADTPIGDSADYLHVAELESCACPCGSEVFELTLGVSLYRESEDVRWLYLGARCTKCGLTACYQKGLLS